MRIKEKNVIFILITFSVHKNPTNECHDKGHKEK